MDRLKERILSGRLSSTDETLLGTAIGLSQAEEAIYRLLLDQQGQTVAEVARSAQVSERRARELVANLEGRGLVTRTPTRPPRYWPADPRTALQLLLLRKHDELLSQQASLEQAQRIVDELGEAFRVGARPNRSGDLVEVITGYSSVFQRLQHEMGHAEREILGFGKSPVQSPSAEFTDFKVDLLQRGVASRAVYDPDTLHVPGQVEFLEVVAAAGEQSRIAPDLPIRLLLVDGRVAMTPLQMDGWEEWLLVQSPPLVNAFSVMFETVWGSATRFPLEPPDEARPGALRPSFSADDQRLLVLLAHGAGEEAIADSLGVTPRTVDRRVSRIMGAFGVSTRFQLGLALRDGEWLAPPKRPAPRDLTDPSVRRA